MRSALISIGLLLCTTVVSWAGGPAFVAGSGHNPGVIGQPMIWANGSIQYFTDQGDLSPILSGAQADALVATAFAAWTGVSGVALTASQVGHLAEDVNGSNIAADGVTPVSGATIAWSTTNGLQFSACKGASTCSVLSDEAGESSSWVTPTATGPSSVTVALAPLSYSPPQMQLATVLGTTSVLDLAALTPTRWIGQGARVAVPLTVEVLDLGVPQPSVAINFKLTTGTASLSSASATTNGFGFASVTANVTKQNSDVRSALALLREMRPARYLRCFRRHRRCGRWRRSVDRRR